MQTKIKNNTPVYLDNESIQEQINTIKEEYMNSNIQILKVTATQAILKEDILLYELLIWDSSEETISTTPEEYLNLIFDYKDYAIDNDCTEVHAKIEIISKEEKLSKISLSLTF